ncbi:Orotidine 5'-phosphate decarboxylase [Usitatibacter rugosus]|uniref:Orotidine 5'-phosphate decarboxylase n=1 Tax=Usitatibacter rugosus TaxID=2732067 RepID=A0A6M4GYR4_9PROT|nr:orotidine-5'-phosphate decarboxylase [Usitatibacter rugosus]QJR11553.1 Orotidine 5'-phosphate decarboxylase [Usitatibacter rugosus]
MDNKIVVVPLDFPDAASALAMAARLDPRLCRVKVGKELFVAAGPAVVEQLHQRGFEVFLDLKFHDIPNTVAGACKSAARLGVWMMNVHASGGEAMLRAAREAVASVTKPPLLIGVTILTSLDDESIARVGFSGSVRENVERLARLTKECGLDGVVCSAQEAPWVRAAAGTSFTLVTPGIRLATDAKGDQVRTVTPAEAVKLGADYLVIGRPITRATDPVAVLEGIRRELGLSQEAA